MAWLHSSGVKNMALSMMHDPIFCTISRIPQHVVRSRWFVGSFIHRGTQFHNSLVLHSSSPSGSRSMDKLMDQGKRSVLKLKSRDNVPMDYKLIYKASMELTLRVSYPIFMMCMLGMFGSLIYTQYYKENLAPTSAGDMKFLNPKQELWFFSIGMLLLVLAGSAVMLKYPFRIYKHSTKREYIALYLNPVLPILRQVQFKTASPTEFKNPLYFLMEDCHYILDGKRKTFLISHFFRMPKDLTDMYEEPKHYS